MSEHTLRRLADLERRTEHDRVLSGASLAVVARAQTAAAQSIANATTTIVDYTTITIDTHGRVTGGALWRFTANSAGYYHIDASILFTATATWAPSELGQLMIYKNGVLWSVIAYKDNFGGATAQFMQLHGGDLVDLLVGDSINVRVFQSTGGALALHTDATYNYVSIARV